MERNRNRNNNTIKKRCDRIMNGEMIQLYNELSYANNKNNEIIGDVAHGYSSNEQKDNSNQNNFNNKNNFKSTKKFKKKVIKIAEDGYLKKSLALISNNGIADMKDPIKLDLLKSKYPKGRPIVKRPTTSKHKWT